MPFLPSSPALHPPTKPQHQPATYTRQEPSQLRGVVALSAAATLLYTPVLKRLTGVKNAAVAAVIALAPLAGALAAGAVRRGLRVA